MEPETLKCPFCAGVTSLVGIHFICENLSGDDGYGTPCGALISFPPVSLDAEAAKKLFKRRDT